MNIIQYTELNYMEKKLVLAINRIRVGHIYGLGIHNGEPDFSVEPVAVRGVKTARPPGKVPPMGPGDTLHKQMAVLIHFIREQRWGMLRYIEISRSLPQYFEMQESLDELVVWPHP